VPGIATVSAFDQLRGGDVVLVDVRDQAGHVVARRHEVNGEAPTHLGATFPVKFLPVAAGEDTRVYVVGHDPFSTNAAVFAPVLLVWLISLPFALSRLFKLAGRVRRRVNKKPKGQYQAGRGYVED
jgi:hypothetical protein